jgi:hypothetical protein
MAKRGVSIDGTTVPVTGASISPTRSLITEQSFGSAGEAKIYDGGVVTTGSFDGAFRATGAITTAITEIMSVMAGTTDALTKSHVIIIGDEISGISFSSCAINSFELSLSVKDYAKVKLGFISYGLGTTSSISATTNYTDPIPVASTSQITCSAAGAHFSGITIKGEIPIDQDYYVIGTKQLFDIIQSGNGSLSGSLTLASTEWAGLLASASACGNLGEITLELNTAGSNCASSPVSTITIKDAKIESGSVSGQGRSRFEKSINWRAEVNAADSFTIT